ncbi:MAG: diacylglycerol kinase family lipid kinase [Chloroflexi bacterium]|nr:diacylglycerol kinase family lipid kinase [Chloroflexota bacterium]
MKQLPQATLIYNPLAGPANLAAPIALVADMWQAQGWDISICPTKAPGHATELAAAAAAANHRVVLAAGGDGTLGEIANGLAGTYTAMAPLPVGTSNSFARELLMPRPNILEKHKLLDASEALLAGQIQMMDMGSLTDAEGNGRNWLLWAGTGADGYLVDRIEPRPKWSKKMGRIGYFLQSFAAAPSLPQIQARIEIDGTQFEDHYILILVSNCRLYAGGQLMLSPDAALDDGLLEVWMFQGDGLATAVQYFLEAKLERHQKNPNIRRIRGRNIIIHTDPAMPCQTDGDKAGNTPIHIQIKPGALRLLVPNTAPPDLFTQPGEPL